MADGVVLQPGPDRLTAHRRSLKALTGIRFFAAFYVVIFHTRVGSALYQQGHHAAGNFFLNGFLAVPLFFLLSGFILAYTYQGQIETAGDHRRFWEARFARIWPVYMVSLLLSSLPQLQFPPFPKALATILMIQAWNPFDLGLAGTWNFVCWTLSVEAFFYLVFPWFQVWIERHTPRMLLTITALMILLVILTNSCSRTLGYTPHGIFRFLPFPLVHLAEFLTGVGLGNHFLARVLDATDSHAPLLPLRGLFTYSAAAAAIALLCIPASPYTSLVFFAFSALIYALAAESTLLSRFLSTPLMLLGGGISYSVYLMQMPAKALGAGAGRTFRFRHSARITNHPDVP